MPALAATAPPPQRGRWLRRSALVALIAIVGAASFLIGSRNSSNAGNDGAEVASQPVASPTTGAETSDGQATDSQPTGGTGDDGEAADAGDGSTTDGEPLYVASDVADDANMDFVVDGTDDLGRPIPALPDELIPNTADATSLAGYYPDPVDAPPSGPYTLIQGGRFYLRGTVPSENIRQELIRQSLLVLPFDVVVVEYEIDPNEAWYLDDIYPVLLEDDILFEPGSSEVSEAAIPLMQVGANLIGLDPDLGIRITGHADSQGSSDSNLELSRERAEAVRAVYLSLGSSIDQVLVVAKGESEPIADNSTEDGRRANRRVEFELVPLDSDQ